MTKIDKMVKIMGMLPNVTLEYPFDFVTKVFKVNGKIFAIYAIDDSFISLKNIPIANEILRDAFEEVTPGYHLNKHHWNSWNLTTDLKLEILLEQIEISYNLIVSNFSMKIQQEIFGKKNKEDVIKFIDIESIRLFMEENVK